jgi:AraC-like DNA-binding protein
MNITNSEYKPSHRLNHYVESYWCYQYNEAATCYSPPNICIPKGTVEFIVTLQGEAELLEGSNWVRLDEALIVGIKTSPSIWRVRGGTKMFGIRLKPETCLQLFGTPVAEIFQKHTAVQNVVGERLNWFVEYLKNAPGTRQRIAIVESFLSKKLALYHYTENLLTKALRTIWKEEGNITTSCLSKKVYIGERQLQRLFKTTVGISPKLYSRIVRFRMAYEKAQSERNTAWTDVAYHHGYTDQAHFVKDFKAFTGLTPTALFT